MTGKITKPDMTPQNGENNPKKITLERAKELLSQKNTATKLQIIEWPIGCLLWVTLFDQSPEAQQISWLWFTVLAEFDDEKIGVIYGILLDKKDVWLEGQDIIVGWKIVKAKGDEQSPIGEEKFIFLPEGTEVKIRYNQDTSTGDIEITSYPLSLYDESNKEDITIDDDLEIEENQINVVSKLTWELNEWFIQIQNGKNDIEKTEKDSFFVQTKEELVKNLNLARKCNDKKYTEEVYNAIKESSEYKYAKNTKQGIKEKKNHIKEDEEKFEVLQKNSIEELRKYTDKQEK